MRELHSIGSIKYQGKTYYLLCYDDCSFEIVDSDFKLLSLSSIDKFMISLFDKVTGKE